jgi:pimeloyl-ACP methyl ester carboxylesterase
MGQQSSERERPTLVFIHGSGDSARAWTELMARLPEYHCVALDLPGHGAQIERPGPSAMGVADYADGVRATLMRQGLSNVCLVGHSLGSAIALRLASDHPSLVSRIVLVGSGARLRVLPALLDTAKNDPAEAKRQIGPLGFAPEHAAQAEDYARAQQPTAPGMLYRDLAACDVFDMMSELGRVSQSALVVVGESDRLTPPKYATYLSDHLAHATLVTIANAGHYVQVEAPDALADALRRWLEMASRP